MKSFCKLTSALTVLAVLLSLSSLATGAENESKQIPELNLQSSASESSSDAAVVINGEEIKENEIDQQVQQNMQRLPAQIPEQQRKQYRQRMKRQVLQQVVVEKLLDEQIKKQDIKVSDQEVVDYIKEMASQQETPMSLEEVKQLVEAQGQNFEDVKENIKGQLKYKKLLEKQFGNKIEVTEKEAEEYYKNNKQEFENPEQVKASHILIKSDPNDQNKSKKKAENLLKQIKEGADFAALAKANSDCPSSQRGGDLGFFGKGQMAPPFEKAAFALDVNEISDVVKTKFGYHIIKKTDYNEPSTTSFKDAKENIMEQLKNQKRGELARNYINKLKEEAEISYPGGKPQPARRPRPAPQQAPTP
jgi:peptidyl-prolyl cis-trans isomerase C